MDRQTAYRHLMMCANVPDSNPHARALYAYAVKRKFPSPEVLYNKALEMQGHEPSHQTRFADIPEDARIGFTLFGKIAELLEEWVSEPVDEWLAPKAASPAGEPQGNVNPPEDDGLGKPEPGAAPDALSTAAPADVPGPTDGAPVGTDTPITQPEDSPEDKPAKGKK